MISRLIARVGIVVGAAFLFGAAQAQTRPANDNYANRTLLQGSSFQFSGTTLNATLEPNENLSAFGFASVWWRWTPPSSGIAVIKANGQIGEMIIFRGPNPIVDFQQSNQLAIMSYADELRTVRVRSGESYSFVLYGSEFDPNVYTFQVSLQPGAAAPANDNFADRINLSGTEFDLTGSVYGATYEVGENLFVSDDMGSTWWSWSAPSIGWIFISTTNHAHLRGPFVQLSQGAGLQTQTYIPYAPSPTFPLGIRANAGQYNLSFHGSASTNLSQTYHFKFVESPPPPANDALANRALLTGANIDLPVNFFGATFEPGEGATGYYDQVKGSLWWVWTPNTDGYADIVTVDGSAERFIESVVVYKVSEPVSMNNLGSIVSSATSYDPVTYSIRTKPGESYLILFKGTAYTNFTQVVPIRSRGLPVPPSNDNFANRTQLQGSSFDLAANVFGSTYEAGETNQPVVDGGSVWWSWTAAASGVLEIQAWSSFDLYRMSGSAIPSGNDLVPGSHNGFVVEYPVQEGQEYAFRISGASLAPTALRLVVSLRSPPVNDDFANRITLLPGNQEFVGALYGATNEIGESSPYFGFGSVWWKWTPPLTGYLLMEFLTPTNFYNGGYLTEIRLSRGTTLETFNELSVGGSEIRRNGYLMLTVTNGQDLAIQLSGPNWTNITHRFKMTVSETPIILGQPVSQSIAHGGSAIFEVYAPGIHPSIIRWQKNGVEIPDAYGLTLPLQFARSTNAGSYRAVVGFGSAVSYSDVATLSVGPPIQPIVNLAHAGEGNQFDLLVNGVVNYSYWVLSSGNLESWQYHSLVKSGAFSRLSSFVTQDRTNVFIRVVESGDRQAACIANLRKIEAAKRFAGWYNRRPEDSTVFSFDLNDLFDWGPVCPENGAYNYGTYRTQRASCSIPGHTLE